MTTTGTPPSDQRPPERCPPPRATHRREVARDLGAVAAAGAVVLLAALLGTEIQRHGQILYVDWPPLYAEWLPHLGPGTPAVCRGPRLAATRGP